MIKCLVSNYSFRIWCIMLYLYTENIQKVQVNSLGHYLFFLFAPQKKGAADCFTVTKDGRNILLI